MKRILVLTAVDDEYNELLNASQQLNAFYDLEEIPNSSVGSYALLKPKHYSSNNYEFIIARCGMGVLATTSKAHLIFCHLPYDYITMCGVCAGDPAKTSQGDLVVASCVWRYGPGKLIALKRDDKPHLIKKENVEIETLQPTKWNDNIPHFKKAFISHYNTVLESKWPDQTHIRHRPRVHFEPVLTMNDIIIDESAFDEVDKVQRKTLALDMESYAIGALCKILHLKGWLLVKGVQDYARPAEGESDKNDIFRTYSAYSSALFLLSFLSKQFHESSIPLSAGNQTTQRSRSHLNDLPPLITEHTWHKLSANAFSNNHSLTILTTHSSEVSERSLSPIGRHFKAEAIMTKSVSVLDQHGIIYDSLLYYSVTTNTYFPGFETVYNKLDTNNTDLLIANILNQDEMRALRYLRRQE